MIMWIIIQLNKRRSFWLIITGIYNMCTKEDFIKKFGTWSSGNANIDKIIQESQINNPEFSLRWIPYDNFFDIEHIADSKYYALHSARLKNYMMCNWDYEYEYRGYVALKELKDYRYDILEFIKAIKNISNDVFNSSCITRFFGISKNPSMQNYIIVMKSGDDTIHDFLSDHFLKIWWDSKTEWLRQTIESLHVLHENDLIHCDLHSRNVSMKGRKPDPDSSYVLIDTGLCKLSNDLTYSDNKNNNVYGSIPYVPPEVLRGNEFTKEGDIYSFGGIMYEMATGNQPFADQAHDTYLMIDICNGVRPKVPDMMLNFIPKCYLDLMYRCWDDDPSKRPNSRELNDIISSWSSYEEFSDADLNRERINKSHEQKLLQSLYNFHPQSCYISRHIYTLYELRDSLEDIKSGKCADLNLCTYDTDSSESSKCIDLETQI
ncbi:hypothetical protein Glove_109g163 [Diversispora epigaea]|uniref:Protein kinase domain-containing protein n=1 Tax=Diversispora epigaea TaxID=1348612 RepID=A0A397JBF4_9GLOM|nr:hypothetical protein Glove_109g163 [Diversispora epigaea]